MLAKIVTMLASALSKGWRMHPCTTYDNGSTSSCLWLICLLVLASRAHQGQIHMAWLRILLASNLEHDAASFSIWIPIPYKWCPPTHHRDAGSEPRMASYGQWVGDQRHVAAPESL